MVTELVSDLLILSFNFYGCGWSASDLSTSEQSKESQRQSFSADDLHLAGFPTKDIVDLTRLSGKRAASKKKKRREVLSIDPVQSGAAKTFAEPVASESSRNLDLLSPFQKTAKLSEKLP